MKHLMGLRTFIGVLVGILALVVGLKLVHPEHRKDVYVFFSGSLVGLIGALAAKSVGAKAVGDGEGLKQGLKNLMGPSKPGDPP